MSLQGLRHLKEAFMKFTKMQGIGNDYVYVNCFEEQVNNPSELAIEVSDRHFGIGADGLILIKPDDTADFYMEMYNADGSQGRMCGNGIRCVGKYVYDNGLTGNTDITVNTLSGIKYLHLNVEDGKVKTVRVNMGEPILKPEQIPVAVMGDMVKKFPLTIENEEYYITCVSMGNPHCVTYMDNIKDLEIEKIGPLFENNSIFPDRVNTEFVKIIDRDNLEMRVWERGSGETLACGTGACAVAVASILNGYCNDSVTIRLLGGQLKITWDRQKNTVFMEGPAEVSFVGEWRK